MNDRAHVPSGVCPYVRVLAGLLAGGIFACRAAAPTREAPTPPTVEERVAYEMASLVSDPLFVEFGVGAEVALFLDAEDVFATEVLDDVERLTEVLRTHRGIRRVESLATRSVVALEGEDLAVSPYLDVARHLDTSGKRRQLVEERSWGRPLYDERAHSTMLLVYRAELVPSSELLEVARATLPGRALSSVDVLRAKIEAPVLDSMVLPAAVRVRLGASGEEAAIAEDALECLSRLEDAVHAAEPEAAVVSLLAPLSVMQSVFSEGAPVPVALTPGAVRHFLLQLPFEEKAAHAGAGFRSLMMTVPVSLEREAAERVRDAIEGTRCEEFEISSR